MPKIQNKQILEGRIGMRYKTDLKAVQSVAKSLLYTTVHETDIRYRKCISDIYDGK